MDLTSFFIVCHVLLYVAFSVSCSVYWAFWIMSMPRSCHAYNCRMSCCLSRMLLYICISMLPLLFFLIKCAQSISEKRVCVVLTAALLKEKNVSLDCFQLPLPQNVSVFETFMFFFLTTPCSLSSFCSYSRNSQDLRRPLTTADPRWLPSNPETTSATQVSRRGRVSHRYDLLFPFFCGLFSI